MDRGQSQGKIKRAKEESTEGASTSSFTSPEATGVGSGQYDVFLSFRGSDTRCTFTDHLYHSLIKAGTFCVFRDENNIPIGEEFGPKILDSIARSKISIPVISENYASSKWCLRELIHIMDHKKNASHIVLPIFYNVAPSDVRHLRGNFGNAFHSSRKYFNEKDIQEGQRALNEVSYLNGWESQKIVDGHEGKLIQLVVKDVISKLQVNFQLDVPEELVGLDNRMKEIMNWINNPSTNARMIGIYGMGGIGKTTLAKCIYNQLLNKFVHVSFLPNVRETIRQKGITYLQSQLISDILQSKSRVSRIDDGINIIKSRFKGKKILILLDDIDHNSQLDALARERHWFMARSVIIVTTRNKAVLDQSKFEVDYKYELNELGRVQALLLFNRHAFGMDHSPREFESISRDIISNMGGLPLALKVVGSYLYKKTNQKVWEDVQEQLKNEPHRDIQKILQISYDALKDGHKQIFLDIVCFFNGKTSKYAMYMWDDCGLYPNQGIEELKLRCLIKIGDRGELLVHDQLRDLGRRIFCQGQPLEKHIGPWDSDYEGVPKVLIIDAQRRPSWFPSSTPSRFPPGFRKILWRHLSCFRFRDNLRAASSETSNKELLSEVRYLEWMVRPSDLSLSMHLSNLSVLNLYRSVIKEDWRGWRSFMASKRLKVLILRNCYNLKRTPDVSAFRQLKRISFCSCYGLKHLHPSIGKLTSLVSMDLRFCKSLEELPEEMGKLKDLEELLLSGTSIIEIPTFIGSLTKLEKLSADFCESLREIPNSIGYLHNLHCLEMHGSGIKKLPNAIGRLKNLQILDLSQCHRMKGAIPSEIGDLPSLKVLDLNRTPISNLPESILNLSSLQSLYLRDCKQLRSLPELPSSLQRLDLQGCKELQSLPELPSSLQRLDLQGCKELWSLPQLPSSLQCLDLKDCKELQSLPELPSSLQRLDLQGCKELRSLPELPSSLQGLDLGGCKQLLSLPEFLPSLQSLDLQRCKEHQSLPLP
ncbi:hypothetical protein ACJRO7_011068 [Eucalyptus globulus]|uniref:TIR domain-containing protein n=1 Tax=Eucalyptus globulus TaxID=34317 RepID=A0ABD3LET6_EUCGL